MSPKALPSVSLLATFWGTSLVVARFSLGQFTPLAFVSLRLVIASAAFAVVYLLSRRRSLPRGREVWRQGMIMGIFSTALPMTLIVSSMQYQSSGVTALILTVSPAMIVVMAHFLLPDEKMTIRKAAGVTVAFSGAVLLIVLGENGLPNVTAANPIGYLMVLGVVVIGSSMVIYIRRTMQNLDSVEVSSVRMWTSAVILIPITFLATGFDLSPVTAQGTAALFYAALIGTFAGMLLDFHNIKAFGATAASVVSILIPIVAIVSGALFLDEAITAGMLVAMIFILSGVLILNLGDNGQIDDGQRRPEAEVAIKPRRTGRGWW